MMSVHCSNLLEVLMNDERIDPHPLHAGKMLTMKKMIPKGDLVVGILSCHSLQPMLFNFIKNQIELGF